MDIIEEVIEDIIEEVALDLLNDLSTYPFPGLWGWLSTITVVSTYTLWAKRTKRSTMSSTLWYYKNFNQHPTLATVIVGSWLYLTYHLLLEDQVKHKIQRR